MDEDTKPNKFIEFLNKRWPIIAGAAAAIVLGLVICFLFLKQGNARDISGEAPDAANDQTTQSQKAQEITGVDELAFDSGNTVPRLNANIEPLKTGKEGLSPESEFKITLPSGYDQNFIEQSLTVSPAIEYSLKQEDESFILKPKQPLQADTVYNFKLADDAVNLNGSWAFQTRRNFRVNSSLPGDKATGVPVNTGIEIVFSHQGMEPLDDYFSITPEVSGAFEYHKNTAVFVPESLEYDTIYTVTLKKGLGLEGSDMTIPEDYIFKFQTESEQQSDSRNNYFYVYNEMNTFPSDTAPYYDISVPEEKAGENVNITVYRYQDGDSYLQDMEKFNKRPSWAITNKDDLIPKIETMDKILEVAVPITAVQDPWYSNYLILPDPLPEGYYFVTFRLGDNEAYCFSQVNDILAYVNVGDKKTLCWLNDIITGDAISGASIEGEGFSPVTTDQNGAALIESPLAEDADITYINLKITRSGHPALIATINRTSYGYYGGYYDYGYGNYYYSSYSPSAKKNWTYFYLDRSVYLPTDTVGIWGLVKPRSGADPYKKLTLCLEGYAYSPGIGYDQATLKTYEVDVSKFGTFETQISYQDLNSGGYELVLKSGDEILNSAYFYIQPYVKPQYTISVNKNKAAIAAGEDVTFDIRANFFEGTPVSGLSIDFDTYGDLKNSDGKTNGTFSLDQSGQYSLMLKAPSKLSNENTNGYPVYKSVYVTNTHPEETNLYGSDSIPVFTRDVLLQTNGSLKDGVASIHASTNKVDIGKVNKTGSLYDENGDLVYKGESFDTSLKIVIYEEYWVGRETGTYYDFISKKTYKKYTYDHMTNKLDEFDINTENGAADLTYTIPSYKKTSSYSYTVESQDTQNRTLSDKGFLYSGYPYYTNDTEFDPRYSLEIANSSYTFKPGETVAAEVLKNGDSFDLGAGRVLYMSMQEGIRDYQVLQSTGYQIDYDKSLIPNSFIYAVLFDGRNIKTTYPCMIRYDTSDEKLDIKVKTDKTEYGPGDDIEVSFEVKDSKGNPCAAEINLSVVDEAYFALYGQSVDIVGELYQSVFSNGIRSEFISYVPYNKNYGGGAECGEGGDENNVRKSFKDNAFFRCVLTGSDGQGKITFKLPDNLTSWRLTYQAVTEDLKAGNGKVNINSKLPFFLQLVSGKIFLEGDVPTFLARGYGTELKSAEPVDYRYEIKNGDGAVSNGTISGKASDLTPISLPKLSEGNYNVTVWAENGGNKDAISQDVHVVKSMLKGTMTKYFNLSDGMLMDFTDSMTTLTFYNKNLLSYYNMLWDLDWSWGDRIDQVLSRKIANEQLNKYFGEDWSLYYDDKDISSYQQDDGGIALLTYGSSDPELSAKVASLDSSFNKNALKDYFYNIINDETQTPLYAAASYWGLAALHEPVLLIMNEYLDTLEKDPQFSLQEKLYMALAYAEIGDFSTAERLYYEVVDRYSVKDASLIYIDTPGDKDDDLSATSLCTVLALKLDMPEKNSMFTYLTRKSTKETLINLEKLAYVVNNVPKTPMKSGFTVTYGGKSENVLLDGIKTYTMMLMPGELKNLKISNVEGTPVVMVSYEGALADLQSTQAQPVSISRRYLVNNSETTKIGTTDIVKVKLTVSFSENAPEGWYEITDVLPAGLRYAYPQLYPDSGCYFDWTDPQGQIVKMGCYFSKKTGDRTLEYYARVVAPGVYTADNACVKDSQSDVAAFAERTTVTIGD